MLKQQNRYLAITVGNLDAFKALEYRGVVIMGTADIWASDMLIFSVLVVGTDK